MKNPVTAGLAAAAVVLFSVGCRNAALPMPIDNGPGVEPPTQPDPGEPVPGPDPVELDLPPVPSDLNEVADDFQGPGEFWEFRGTAGDGTDFVEHYYFDVDESLTQSTTMWLYEYVRWNWDSSSRDFTRSASAEGSAGITIDPKIEFELVEQGHDPVPWSGVLRESGIIPDKGPGPKVQGIRYAHPKPGSGVGEHPYGNLFD